MVRFPTCGRTCATGVLIYVCTALVLEVYWMHPLSSVLDSEREEAASHLAVPSMAPTPPPASFLRDAVILPGATGDGVTAPSPPPAKRRRAEHGHHRSERTAVTSSSSEATRAATSGLATEAPAVAAPAAATVAPAATAVLDRAASTTARAHKPGERCWKMPAPFLTSPFDAGLAAVVWTRSEEDGTGAVPGPLRDVPSAELSRDWSASKQAHDQ